MSDTGLRGTSSLGLFWPANDLARIKRIRDDIAALLAAVTS